MRWPEHSVESIPPREFWPPFCPRESCPSQRRGQARFHRHRVYYRKCDGRLVCCFRCVDCGKTCGQQTFAGSYYLKRPELLEPIAAGLVAGSGHRQLARSLRCAPSTVTRFAARLGRHSLLLQARLLAAIESIREPVVHDDLETFAFAQDQPVGIGTPVGKRSWFVYGLESARHRRGGRSARRASRARERHPELAAYARSFARVLDLLAPRVDPRGVLELLSDAKDGYRVALARHPARKRFRHRVWPNPPRQRVGGSRSPAARRRDREMFAADLLHKLIRHSQAHHRRETIAFARRLNALLERGFVFVIWRNLIKARTERRPDPTTPAMWLGLVERPWSWGDVLARRLFAWRETVPKRWMTIYRRELITPAVGRNQRHRLVNAF